MIEIHNIHKSCLDNFSKQVEKTYLLFSKDDPVVPFVQVKKYKNILPNSEVIPLGNRQHFKQESFPEIVELIKNI